MKRLICRIVGHNFISLKGKHSHIREYQCDFCKQKYTEDSYGQLFRLTKYWEENNMLFEKHFSKGKIV